MLVSSSPKTSTYDYNRIMDEAAVRLKAQVASVSVNDDPIRSASVDGMVTDDVEHGNVRSSTPVNAGHSDAPAPLVVSTNAAAPTTPIETSSSSSNRMFRQLYLACPQLNCRQL